MRHFRRMALTPFNFVKFHLTTRFEVMCNHDGCHAVTVIVMCMVQYSMCHHTCAVGLEVTMKTETKQSQNVHITIVPHSDAYLTSLHHLTLNHMSYS